MSLCGRHPPPHPAPQERLIHPPGLRGAGGRFPRGGAASAVGPRLHRLLPVSEQSRRRRRPCLPAPAGEAAPPLPLGAPTRARGRLAMGGERAARGLGCGQVQRSLRPPSAPAHPGPAPRPDPRPPTSEASICLSSLPMFASLISVTDHLRGHRLVINLFREPLAFPSGPHWRDGTWHCHPSPAACGR